MVKVHQNVFIEKEIIVSPYLSYAQIQSIVNAVCKFDTWSERQQNIDILLLHFATNLTDDEIEEYGHEQLLQSGVIEEVKQNIKNLKQVYEAIEYTQSIQRALNQIAKELPTIMEPLKRTMMERGNKSSKK